MAQELINLGISPEVIKPIVNTHIKALIVEALGGTQNLVDKAVEGLLKTYVDRDNGKITSSGSYNSAPLFDFYFNKLLAESIKEAIQEAMTENKEQVKEAVKRSLMRKKGDALADAVIDCIIGTFGNEWRSKVEVKLTKEADEY